MSSPDYLRDFDTETGKRYVMSFSKGRDVTL